MLHPATGDKIEFDDLKADDELVRTVFLKRLKTELAGWHELGLDGWDKYVEFAHASYPAQLVLRATRVYWQLVNEGIIHPGRLTILANISSLDANQLGPPYFSLTPYGKEVLDSPAFEPHYPNSYMNELLQIGDKDPTTVAYMLEAVQAFRRGSLTASMLLLGVAAERVFVRVCEAIADAIDSPAEASRFHKLIAATSMKPKLDWVSAKLETAKKQLPDGSALLVLSIYNLMRLQRNDLGHPQETPPNVKRHQARAYLKMFPPSYEKAQELVVALKSISL